MVESRSPRYVIIEGPIGVGKTTLCLELQRRLNAPLILEEFAENPYLPLLYTDRKRYGLQTELFFLMSRHKQQKKFHQEEAQAPRILSDYLFRKCRIFAGINLSSQDLPLFDEIYQLIDEKVPKPDLLIYLDAPTEIILERIDRRGRPYEKQMDRGYIEELQRAYLTDFLDRPPAPLLTVNTAKFDLRTPKMVTHLIEAINRGERGNFSP